MSPTIWSIKHKKVSLTSCQRSIKHLYIARDEVIGSDVIWIIGMLEWRYNEHSTIFHRVRFMEIWLWRIHIWWTVTLGGTSNSKRKTYQPNAELQQTDPGTKDSRMFSTRGRIFPHQAQKKTKLITCHGYIDNHKKITPLDHGGAEMKSIIINKIMLKIT